jgi:hypothetical protein
VIAWLLFVVLGTTPIAIVALWLTFQHKPGWYCPAVLGEPGMQQARSAAVQVADYVSDQMVLGQPFEAVFHDCEVNKWLAALPYSWPEASDVLPPEITDLAVRFESGKVRAGAHYERNGWQAILSVGLTVSVSADGNDISIALDGVYGGSLPVPRVVLRRMMDQLLESFSTDRDLASDGMQPLASAIRNVQSAEDLFSGLRIRNRFVWFNGDRPFRIKAVDIGEGELRLRIEPL